MENFPVDIVYLWCDSSDKKWILKKNDELKKCGKVLDSDAIDDCRFINNDELKYSLRSLEKYAPWINNIFIVTDNQVPSWLDTANPKIHIVNHSEILPSDALPTFNASAIETALHKIPELSEHFLFANDDMFFGNFADKSFFFDLETGLPIFRFSKRKIINKTYKHLYGYMVSSAYRLVAEKYGVFNAHFPHHNIDAYRKSDIEKCYEEFRDGFEKTARQKFRENDCIQRSIFGYYSIANGLGKSKVVDDLRAKLTSRNGLDSLLIELKKSKLKLLDKYNPVLFCLNDSLKTTNEDRIAMKDYLKDRFNEPSSFEISAGTDLSPSKDENINALIAICYHKEFEFLKNDVLKPIQVGASLSQVDLGIEKDNTGDNISEKNKNFCELTALYWMWKNSNADIKGLMHYRRLFDLACNRVRRYNGFPENITEILHLNKDCLLSVFKDYDVILPEMKVMPKYKSNYLHYKKKHIISDMDKVFEIIKEKHPQYYQTAVEVIKNNNHMYLFNMFVAKTEIFNDYAAWLFDILFTLEKEIKSDILSRDAYQQRVYGFLSERLFNVYIEYQKQNGLRFKEVPVVYCETDKKSYNAFMRKTKLYRVLVKLGIRKSHWKEQYGV